MGAFRLRSLAAGPYSVGWLLCACKVLKQLLYGKWVRLGRQAMVGRFQIQLEDTVPAIAVGIRFRD